jgi:hypothetical protein
VLSRDEAITIAEKYDGLCSDNIINSYANYVGISVSTFWDITNKWVNTDIFKIQSGARPIKKFTVGVDYES